MKQHKEHHCLSKKISTCISWHLFYRLVLTKEMKARQKKGGSARLIAFQERIPMFLVLGVPILFGSARTRRRVVYIAKCIRAEPVFGTLRTRSRAKFSVM